MDWNELLNEILNMTPEERKKTVYFMGNGTYVRIDRVKIDEDDETVLCNGW